jgi:O-antigen/teichoic acid export membrane protein
MSIEAIGAETTMAHRGWVTAVAAKPLTYAVMAPVLSLASAMVGILVPALLDPVAFGTFILVSTLFQYAQTFDLGMAQMMDRLWGRCASRTVAAGAISDILWVRLYLAVAVIIGGVGVSSLIDGHDAPVSLMVFAVAGGALFTASMGPVTLYRARSDAAPFTFSALALQLGMIMPRGIGLIFAGVAGCFASMMIWYAATAAVLNKRAMGAYRRPPGLGTTQRLVRAAFPLLMNTMLLMGFLTAHRWVSAMVSEPEAFGYYAFGANLLTMAVGALTPVAQVYYPRRARLIAREGMIRTRARIDTDMMLLFAAMVGACAVAQIVTPMAIDLVFPAYHGAIHVARVTLCALVPIMVVTWLSPLILAVCDRPWLNALPLVAGIVTSTGGVWGGQAVAGLQGQAWANAFGALALVTVQVGLAARMGVLGRGAAIALTVCSCGFYVAMAWLIGGVK